MLRGRVAAIIVKANAIALIERRRGAELYCGIIRMGVRSDGAERSTRD